MMLTATGHTMHLTYAWPALRALGMSWLSTWRRRAVRVAVVCLSSSSSPASAPNAERHAYALAEATRDARAVITKMDAAVE